MKITIESTDEIVVVDGVECRVWNGATENGVRCHLLVHRVAAATNEYAAEFESELNDKAPPVLVDVDRMAVAVQKLIAKHLQPSLN